MHKIGFGGSCHWCTEAIFQSLKGVNKVQQGWIASDGYADYFSEAVIVHYDVECISLQTLIAIHLYTHSCTADHSMRSKYRSSVYTFNEEQIAIARQTIQSLQPEFEQQIVTTILPFKEFKLNQEQYLNYYYSNPDKPFCLNIVNPKLKLLRSRFKKEIKSNLL
jgi:peptide-methionine (S)-S-oxide reductase